MSSETLRPARQKGFLGFVERVGNLLPDPTIIFIYLIVVLMLVSALGAALGWSASLPYSGKEAPANAELANGMLTYRASSLFSAGNITRAVHRNAAHLFQLHAARYRPDDHDGRRGRRAVGDVLRADPRFAAQYPAPLHDPLIAVIGMVSHHAADAAYVVLIPLSAVLFASVGRHPLAGIAAALAAVSGGYAGNIMPGQLDVLLFGFTQEAARIVNPAGR